jgi:hypothetical protein
MKPRRRRATRQLLVARREVRRFATAEKRAAAVESPRAAPSFRPLSESETEAIVGAELLAKLTRLKAERRSYKDTGGLSRLHRRVLGADADFRRRHSRGGAPALGLRDRLQLARPKVFTASACTALHIQAIENRGVAVAIVVEILNASTTNVPGAYISSNNPALRLPWCLYGLATIYRGSQLGSDKPHVV